MSNTIKNGNAITVPVQTGESLTLNTITGTYTATIVSGAGMGTVLATASDAGATYGPYAGPVVIEIRCSSDGLTDFEVGTAPTLDYELPVGAKIDSATGGLELVVAGALLNTNDPNAWPFLIPQVLSSPPTVTNGVANAASAIAGSILHSSLESCKFTVLGGPSARGINYPDYNGLKLGVYPQITSVAPTAVEFNLDTVDATGRFEIYVKGSTHYRVLIKQAGGNWGAATQYATRALPVDGNLYRDLITLGAAGFYTLRIEFYNAIFFGIQTAATDTVTALKPHRRRYIVVGDSFTEPTFSDSGTTFHHYGWVQQLSMLTGLDIWSAGSGGTGYVAPGAKVKFADRLQQDILAYNPQGVIFAGGINDTASSISTFATEVDACLTACRGKELIVLSPFYPKGIDGIPDSFWQYVDVLEAAATTHGAKFINLVEYGGVPSFLSAEETFQTTLASAYVSGTAISVTDKPAYFKTANTGVDHWFVKVGSGASQVVREVVGISGAGPYTLNVVALGVGFSAGAAVTLAGNSYQTGTGRQGATTGAGNSDRYTGTDATHPTVAGHQNIARCVADLWARAIT